ncbi:ATPase family AAA domain-containing protein 1-B, partial [Aphis craccivora]
TSTSDLQPPKGILLYGQSDCRNKMIARKIIRKEGIHCIRLDIESIDDRWRGEYKEFSLAIWSLAEIIQPCIIFIDGIGLPSLRVSLRYSGFTYKSTGSEFNVFLSIADIKEHFLQDWFRNSKKNITVMGTINKLEDLDQEIRRRMPVTIEVPTIVPPIMGVSCPPKLN